MEQRSSSGVERPTRVEQLVGVPASHRVFVVYAPEDTWFVEGFLLQALGIPEDDVLMSSKLELGAPIVKAIERGALCPVTVVVMSPAFLVSPWAQFAYELATHHSVEAAPDGSATVVQAVVADCELPLLSRFRESLDFRRTARAPRARAGGRMEPGRSIGGDRERGSNRPGLGRSHGAAGAAAAVAPGCDLGGGVEPGWQTVGDGKHRQHRAGVERARRATDDAGTRLVTVSSDHTARIWNVSWDTGTLADWHVAEARCDYRLVGDGILVARGPKAPNLFSAAIA